MKTITVLLTFLPCWLVRSAGFVAGFFWDAWTDGFEEGREANGALTSEEKT